MLGRHFGIAAVFLAARIALSAEIKIEGQPVEHRFVRVTSDKPAQWVVIGPDVISFKEQFRVSSRSIPAMSLGTAEVNFRETIVLNDGTQCVFVGPAGTYIAIAYVKEEQQPSHAIVVVAPAQTPVPPIPPAPIPVPPQPIPDPIPPQPPSPAPPIPGRLPDGRYKIAQLAYDDGMKVGAGQRGLAASLARNFRNASAASFRTPAEAVGDLTASNRFVLGKDGDPKVEAWRGWFEAWQNFADALVASGDVRSGVVADWQLLFKETAEGLGAIK